MGLNPRFQIRAPLRCEGVGRLNSAVDLDSGERLAIRWLPLSANGGVVLRTLKPLPAHPALPRIRETGLVGDEAYLALQFPDGRLLPSLTEPLSTGMACKVGASLAEGLAALHEERFFHGELSTESILLVAQDQVIIWDLPLVLANRALERRKEHHAAGQLLRCVPFLSPERAKGGEPSAAADVYALGVVLSVALGLQLPTDKKTLALLNEIANGSWRVVPPAEGSLFAVIGSMLAMDPLDRPSAREVAKQLRELLDVKVTVTADAGEGEAPARDGQAPLAGARRVPARIVMRKVTLPEMKTVSTVEAKPTQPEGRRETVPELRASNPRLQDLRATAPERKPAASGAEVSSKTETRPGASIATAAPVSLDLSGRPVAPSASPGVAAPRLSVELPPPFPLEAVDELHRLRAKWGRRVLVSVLGLSLAVATAFFFFRPKAPPSIPVPVAAPVVEAPRPPPAPAILPALRAEPAPETKRRLPPTPAPKMRSRLTKKGSKQTKH